VLLGKAAQMWKYLGATAQAQASRGVAVWSIRGVVTYEALPRIMADAFAWHEQVRALALVADFRDAAVCVPLDQFVALAALFVRPKAAMAAPMAIVPRAEQALYFRRYSARLAQATGAGRLVMPDGQAALQWAAAIAAGLDPAVAHLQSPSGSASRPDAARPATRCRTASPKPAPTGSSGSKPLR
jgi:hypothetical protein